MKRFAALFVVVFVWLAVGVNSVFANEKLDHRVWESNEVLKELISIPEEGIPPSLLNSAKAIAIFPNMVKAGFIVAGQYGEGVVLHKNDAGQWSAPAFFRMSGAGVGFQIGGSATDVVLVVTNERGVQALLQNKFTLGADASVAAGPVGRKADASTDWKMTASIFSYSRSRGLFAGVSLDGVAVNQNKDANALYYGEPFSAEDILISGKATISAKAQELINTLK